VLRRAAGAIGLFELAYYGPWVAMLVFAYAHGGATTAGVVALAQLAPAALLAPVAGPLMDRYGAGRMLYGGYVAQTVALGATAGSLLAGAPTLVTYAFGAVVATVLTVTHPAHAVVSPRLARTPEQLVALNGISGWCGSLALVVAPASAGLLLSLSTPGTVYAAGAGCVALAAMLVQPLRGLVPPAAGPEHAVTIGLRKELTEGAQALLDGGAAGEVMLVLAASFVMVGAFDVLAVVLAVGVLGLGGSGAGYLNAVYGCGAVLGAGVSFVLLARARIVPVLLGAALVGSAALVVLGAATTVATAFALVVVAGTGRSLLEVSSRTLLQRVTPTALLARVFALSEGLTMTAWAVGSITVPALVGLGGARLALIAGGLIVPAVVLMRLRRLLRVDAAASVPVVEIALLRSTPIFCALPVPALEGVAHGAVHVPVAAGTQIVRQGDEGDRYYVIADGTVEVEKDGRVLATLSRGEGFGEIALLRDQPRMATVTARTDTRLLAVERDAFLVALTGHAGSASGAETIVSARLAERGGDSGDGASRSPGSLPN
jgi:MFS family permease